MIHLLVVQLKVNSSIILYISHISYKTNFILQLKEIFLQIPVTHHLAEQTLYVTREMAQALALAYRIISETLIPVVDLNVLRTRIVLVTKPAAITNA